MNYINRFSIPILFFLLIGKGFSQHSYKLNYKNNLSIFHHKSIPSFSEDILSLGITETFSNDENQVIVIKHTENGLTELFSLLIGYDDKQNWPIDIVEDSYGRIIVLGKSFLAQNFDQVNWLNIRNHKGEFLKERILPGFEDATQLFETNNGYNIFYLHQGQIGLLTLNYDFDVVSDEIISKKTSGQNYTQLLVSKDGNQSYALMALDESNEKFAVPVIYKFHEDRIVRDLNYLSELNTISLGSLMVSDGKYHYTLTVDNDRNETDIQYGSVSNELITNTHTKKVLNYKCSSPRGSCFRNEDIANLIYRNPNGSTTLVNKSNSYSRGSVNLKDQIVFLNKEGELINEPIYPYIESKYAQHSNSTIEIANRAILYCGDIDNGKWSGDVALQFYTIESAVPTIGTDLSMIPDVGTLFKVDYSISSRYSDTEILKDSLNRANIKLTYTGQDTLSNITLTTSDTLNETISLIIPNQSYEINLPVTPKTADFRFDLNISDRSQTISLVKEDLTVIMPPEIEVKLIESEIVGDAISLGQTFLINQTILTKNLITDKDSISLRYTTVPETELSPMLREYKKASDSTVIITHSFTIPEAVSSKYINLLNHVYIGENLMDTFNLPLPINIPVLAKEKIEETFDNVSISFITSVEETTYKKTQELEFLIDSDRAITDEELVWTHSTVPEELGVVYPFKGAKMDEVPIRELKTTDGKKRYIKKFTANLFPGYNEIKLGYVTGQDRYILSDPEVSIKYIEQQKGDLHIISIGIPDKAEKLKFTTKDAIDFANLFVSQERRYFDNVHTTILSNENSTVRSEITGSLIPILQWSELGTLDKKDLIIVFVSSHGFVKDGEHLLQCSNYKNFDHENTSISFYDDIYRKLDKTKANKLYFVDACHSGFIREDLIGRKGTTEDVEYKQALANVLQNEKTSNIMLSCNPDQYSYESENWANSAFIYALKSLLTDEKKCSLMDENDDKLLTLREIEQEFRKTTLTLVSKELGKHTLQTPFAIKSSEDDLDIPFFAY